MIEKISIEVKGIEILAFAFIFVIVFNIDLFCL
jgi:hypothetical protein